MPSAGLVPGDFFYFFDRLGEGFADFFTFDPVAKAERALERAQERASEIHEVLGQKGVSATEIKEAEQDFEEELGRAAALIADEKAKGVDISEVAKGIDDEFELSKDMLKEAYRGYSDDLKEAEKNLRELLKEAVKTGDEASLSDIQAELRGLIDEQTAVWGREGEIEGDFDDEKERLEDVLGAEQAAQSHIENAMRAREALVHEMEVRGITIDKSTLALFEELLAKAQAALKAADFESAKEYAKDAKETLREVRQDVDAKDLERELEDNLRGLEGHDEFMGMPIMPEGDRRGEGKRGAEEMRVEGMDGMEWNIPELNFE